MSVDRTKRGPSPGSPLTALAGRTLGAIPPPALVLLGIVSVQMGSALAKHLLPNMLLGSGSTRSPLTRVVRT